MNPKSHSALVFGIFKRNWVTMIGLVCVVYIWAALSSAYFNNLAIIVDPGVFGYVGVALGACLAALLFCVLLILGKASRLGILEHILPSICAAAMLIARFLGDWSGGMGSLFSNLPLGFSTAALLILAFIELRREITNGAPAAMAIGGTIAVFAAFYLFLLLLWPYITDELADSLNMTLQVIFLLSVSVNMVLRAGQSQGFGPQKSLVSQDPADFSLTEKTLATSDLETICLAIAKRYDLSPRESEILLLIAQGRGTSYISEKLFVSSNTVKTHIKRIYQKCDIHSKEELIDLIRPLP
jgi:DNA-binding CsgD family transcriptional regulator